jgi:hypothetical protein
MLRRLLFTVALCLSLNAKAADLGVGLVPSSVLPPGKVFTHVSDLKALLKSQATAAALRENRTAVPSCLHCS